MCRKRLDFLYVCRRYNGYYTAFSSLPRILRLMKKHLLFITLFIAFACSHPNEDQSQLIEIIGASREYALLSEVMSGFLSEDDMAMLLDASALEPDVLGAMGVDEDYEGPIVGLCRL